MAAVETGSRKSLYRKLYYFIFEAQKNQRFVLRYSFKVFSGKLLILLTYE